MYISWTYSPDDEERKSDSKYQKKSSEKATSNKVTFLIQTYQGHFVQIDLEKNRWNFYKEIWSWIEL